MNAVEDIDSMMIDRSKLMADGAKYFELFEKHIPTGMSGNVLIMSIGNLDCLGKMMSLNKDAKYTVVENSRIIKCLSKLFDGELDIEGIENDGLDLYNIIKELDMKFDCIIMNPPYQRNLHLKILAEAIKHLKDDGTCVNLSPIPRLTSIRNLYDEKTITRNAKTEQYAYLKDVEQIRNGIEIFNAGIQQHLGIQVYSTNKHLIDIEQYVESDLPKDLVKKIMYKCMKYSLLNVEQHGDFELPISDVHGHIGSKDFLNIMALTYECQLSSVGRVKVKFLTENDRHAFYNFWMSSLGRLLTSLWKVDTNVEHRYIPYVWFKDVNEFAKWFDLTPAEQKVIEETMEKYK